MRQHPLAGRRHRRRRHRRPRRRPDPLRGRADRRDRGRGRSRRRKLRAAPGEPGAAPRHDATRTAGRSGWSRCRCRAPLYHEGQRLPASYANFYIANGVVLLPTYDPARDEEARGHAAGALPGRRGRRHRLHRSGLGTRRLPLRHPAVAAEAVKDCALPACTTSSSRSPPAPPAGRRRCPCPRPRCAARPRSRLTT